MTPRPLMAALGLVLGPVLFAGCAAPSSPAQLAADHPANPDAPAAAVPPPSQTLRVELASADQSNNGDSPAAAGEAHGSGTAHHDHAAMGHGGGDGEDGAAAGGDEAPAGEHSGHGHHGAAGADTDSERAPQGAPDARTGSAVAAADARYVCPMHKKVVSDEPGKCPICKMKLKPKPGAKPAKPAAPEAPEAPEAPAGESDSGDGGSDQGHEGHEGHEGHGEHRGQHQ